MLILTRRIGEEVVVGENEVVFKVLGVAGNQVKVGVEAPDHVAINRREIYNRILADRKNKHQINPEE